MPRRTTLALRFSCLAPLLLPISITGCTKGGGLIEGFGSYTGPGGGEGTDDGDTDDDEDDDDEDDGGPGGPLDEGGEDPSADDDTGPPPAGDGDCCVGQETPGCNDPVIAACVCAQDAFCCESVWDDLCASLVVENGCGICEDAGDDGATGGPAEEGGVEEGGVEEGGASEGGASEGGVEEGGVEAGGVEEGGVEEGGGDAGDCCVAHPGTGCGDATIEACVCAQDDYCCATEWDDICVGEVDSFGCGMCGAGEGGASEGGTTEGGGTEGGVEEGGAEAGGGGIGDCCAAQATPGCAEPDVEACVCAADDYCCTTAWDDICVGEVDSLGCGVCGGAAEEGGAGEGGGASNCCAAHPETGCTDPVIEACVCAADDYCCVTEWDDICVGEVDSLGCGVC